MLRRLAGLPAAVKRFFLPSARALAAASNAGLVGEMRRRGMLSPGEAAHLSADGHLADYYDSTDCCCGDSSRDALQSWQPHLRNAIADLKRGDLIEACIELGRANPDLAMLGYRAERGDLVLRSA